MAEGRRDQLLTAAERLIMRKGLAQVTVADITSEAGVAKGTFYLYFTTKDDVVQALHDRVYDFLLERLGAAYAAMTDGDWWGQVDAALEAIVEFAIENRAWHRLVSQSVVPTHDAKGQEAQIIALMTAAIRAGTDEGVFGSEDPEMTAVMLYSACMGAMHQAVMRDELPDRQRLLQAMQQLCRRALSP